MKPFLWTPVLSLLLAGCMDQLLTTDGIIADGWARPAAPYAPKPLYCYKTLAAVECYPQALPGQERRLVQAYREAPPAPVSVPARENAPFMTQALPPESHGYHPSFQGAPSVAVAAANKPLPLHHRTLPKAKAPHKGSKSVKVKAPQTAQASASTPRSIVPAPFRLGA